MAPILLRFTEDICLAQLDHVRAAKARRRNWARLILYRGIDK